MGKRIRCLLLGIPTDIVTPKSLKVVYRGIENELFIEVPNAKAFEVSGNGITKKDKNTYILSPLAGIETPVTINITLKNNRIVTETHLFKIRNLPSLLSTFNGNKAQVIKLQKSGLKDGIVGMVLDDKNIEKTIEIIQFSLKIPGLPAFVINGNKIDDATFEKINKHASKGDHITLFDIKGNNGKFSSKAIFENAPIVIQIL